MNGYQGNGDGDGDDEVNSGLRGLRTSLSAKSTGTNYILIVETSFFREENRGSVGGVK
jgi:hypothetical protein